MNQETKNNRIIGLVIGLIFFLIFFYLDFEELEFGYRINSPIGQICKELSRSILGVVVQGKILDLAEYFWLFLSIVYAILAWKYRGCIGYWFKRIISSLYKKI